MSSFDLSKREINELKKEIKEKYAQKPTFKDRRLDLNEENLNILDRNEFSRDRDRIIYSKAFRRLEHKSQVYSHEKGDHYRTTFTYAVPAIAKARAYSPTITIKNNKTGKSIVDDPKVVSGNLDSHMGCINQDQTIISALPIW